MASLRTEGPTPNGGAYAIAVFVKFEDDPAGSYREVERDEANGMFITEYDAEGKWLFETVGRLDG